MDIKTLVGELTQYDLEVYISNEEKSSIRAVKLFHEKQEKYNQDVLYFVKYSDIQNKLPLSIPINLLCVMDCNMVQEEVKFNVSNIMLIYNQPDAVEIFNFVQDILLKYNSTLENTEKFLNAITKVNSIQESIDMANLIIGNPILVADTAHKILAHTQIGIEDNPWDDITKNGYIPYDITISKEMENFFKLAEINNEPVVFPKVNGPISIVRMIIKIDNKIIGYITVPEYFRECNEGDLKIISLLSNLISIQMQKNNFLGKFKGKSYEYFIRDLLEGKIFDELTVSQRIKFLNWNMKPYIYVIAIETKKFETENNVFTNIIESIQQIVSDSRVIFYQNKILIIHTCDKEISKHNEENLNLVRKLLNREKRRAGISRYFTSITEIYEHYNQALKALEIGLNMNNQDNMFFYEDYVLYDMLDLCREDRNLKLFCHPALFNLFEYDKVNATDFTQCLHTYLLHNRDITETSNICHLHRNTIKYRISRIEEIIKIDLGDCDIAFHLLLSFKILEYLKKMNSTNEMSNNF
jgi:sugar diacid utilization regulator